MEEMPLERKGVKVDFIQGDATDLPHLIHNADAAFFCNAIHLLPDKLSAFRVMASILGPGGIFACNSRSEEHTSELQSHLNLVCRLLLEKKKIDIIMTIMEIV